jgi:hypothetical protein
MSANTPNKNLNVPAHGADPNSWDVPVNANWQVLDAALGGVTSISVTDVTGPTVVLTVSQYTPPNIEFSGIAIANLTYQVPAGVGGIWTINNGGTGPFTLSFGVVGGTAVTLNLARTLVVSDGVNMTLAQTPTTSFTQLTDQIAFAQCPFMDSDNEVDVENLPVMGQLRGQVIAPDPGTTPVGTYGFVFWYYALLLGLLPMFAHVS